MEIREYKIKLGCDPELFLFDRKTAKPVCPYGVVPGSKYEPAPVGNNGNQVQMDGMAVEFCIPPCSDEQSFVDHVHEAQREIQELVGEKYFLKAQTTCDFGDQLFEAPAECRLFGCDPDFEAYTNQRDAAGNVVDPPLPKANEITEAEEVTFRTGGGHVHVGWTDEKIDPFHPEHLEGCRMLTTAMDLFLGVPSTLFDIDTKRRPLYGKAGAFRPKPYGMEYRSLSNFWVDDPGLTRWVYKSTLLAVDELFKRKRMLVRESRETSRSFINEEQSVADTIKFVERLYRNSRSDFAKEAREQFWRCLNV